MKLGAFNRSIAVFVSDIKDPKAKSRRLAEVADIEIKRIRAQNKVVTGSNVPPRVYVDGTEGADLDSVRADGVILANFDPIRAALEWIGEELVKASPILTGRYMRSHSLEIDGLAWDGVGPMPDGHRYLFRNTQPYARKIEPRDRVVSERAFFGDRRKFRKQKKTDVGFSDQAPDGVYAVIAALAETRFGDIARISYVLDNFRAETGRSYPGILVRPF